MVDVYAFPVHYKRYVLEIVDRAKKEDEIPDNLEQEYLEFQDEDEDSLED